MPIIDCRTDPFSGFQTWWGPIDGVQAFGGVIPYYGFVSAHHDQETLAKYNANPEPVDSAVKLMFEGFLNDILQQ